MERTLTGILAIILNVGAYIGNLGINGIFTIIISILTTIYIAYGIYLRHLKVKGLKHKNSDHDN